VLAFCFVGCDTESAPTLTATSYDVVVASDGSGDYRSVQNAIDHAPSYGGSWYTIYIKNGTYREVITVSSDKTYLQLIGESANGTVVTYDNYSGLVGSTSGSATAFFRANNFIARNITFENAFDYPNSSASGKQAVAAEPMADRQVFVNCNFTGYQDTLYVRNGRIYFRDCYIAGHTDFIFGDATAVFDECTIYSRPKNGGCISAPSTLASTAYGLIFKNCDVTGTSTGVWLGRPWHPSSSTQAIKSSAVYLNCYLDSHIAVDGWTSMSGVYPSTERMYEYNNSGPGARVNSSRPQLSAGEAATYTVGNILRGTDGWDPEAWADMETSSDDSDSTTNGTFNGTYSIIAVHSGKALDTWEWGTTDGTNIAQYNYWGGEAQQFNITPVDGIWHRITPVIASDQAMDVSGCVTDAGANIQTWTYWGGECQQFRFQNAGAGKWRIIARNSGLCVDVLNSSTEDGANVIQYNCISGSENQMFELKQH
jgi:pectinesterase